MAFNSQLGFVLALIITYVSAVPDSTLLATFTTAHNSTPDTIAKRQGADVCGYVNGDFSMSTTIRGRHVLTAYRCCRLLWSGVQLRDQHHI
jgi:hypothetical protein